MHSGATPITDDPFHSQVLAHKLQRIAQEPAMRPAIASRAAQRKLKAEALAAAALMDAQVKLPILHPAVPLADVLEYRQKNPDALAKVRETLGLVARRIEAEPWSADFANEIETKTVPELIVQLTTRPRLGAASAVLAPVTAPVTPVAFAIAGLGIVSGSAIPGAEWLLDWRWQEDLELNRAETRVHNFIEFIASGRATPALAEALAQAEEHVKGLKADVASMESAGRKAFAPPPRAWIADRIAHLNALLAERTEQSALALRRLTGAVTLTPERPEVGRPYYRINCRFDSLNLLQVADGGSNLLQWWRRRELNSAEAPASTTKQYKPGQPSATQRNLRNKTCRAAPDLAGEFAAGQTGESGAEELDPELADFRAALVEEAARAEVVRVICGGPEVAVAVEAEPALTGTDGPASVGGPARGFG